MYRALYRKWRPALFSDVFGQEAITTALKNQICHSKVGHAYLFTGTRGTGKTTCAKIFAKAVNCLFQKEGDPCGKCEICTGLDSGSIMDVVEIDAASNNGVDNIRELRDETAYTPASCTYKVYIIDEVHMLSMQAFNALLKIMEEPPSHIIFILATTEIHKVPATILSRCQRYDFTRIPQNAITERILQVSKGEDIEITPSAAALIARLADGALRDALSILETCCGNNAKIDEQTVRNMAGVTDNSYLFELSRTVHSKDISAVLVQIAALREKSIEVKRLCEELINHYRNLLLAGIDAPGLLNAISEDDEKAYKLHSAELSQPQIIRAIKTLGSSLDKMGKSNSARIELELALFQLCSEDAPPALPVPKAATISQQSVPKGFTSAPEGFASKRTAVAPSAPVVAPPQAKATQVQTILPLIPLEEYSEWAAVVAAMEANDKLLYVYMKTSRAYYDGRRVLIDAGELFLEYIRKNDKSKDIIKATIEAVTGKRLAIGPYEKKDTPSNAGSISSVDMALNQLADMGVDIEITE